jgi:hypothetical protein
MARSIWCRSAVNSPSSFAGRLSVRVPAPGTRLPGPVPGACFAGPRSPWSPSPAFARAGSWLDQLRRGSLRLVRRLHGYYHGVRLLGLVRHRLRLLIFPMRTGGVHPPAKPETSRFPCKERPHMPGSLTTPGGMALAIARLPCCLPRYQARRLPDRRTFRGSVAGLCAPLSTLHLHRSRRMTRGQCGSLDLHCKRLALSTLCRFRRSTDDVLGAADADHLLQARRAPEPGICAGRCSGSA